MTHQLLLDVQPEVHRTTQHSMQNPSGYTGLYAFHKYWGKKPHETIAYLIQRLTRPGDTVLDPFAGAGTVAREALLHSRKAIAMDINPVAVEICRLLTHPPRLELVREAFRRVEADVKARILDSYRLEDGCVASHFLWDSGELRQTWLTEGRRSRLERVPTSHDLTVSGEWADYCCKRARPPRFFSNARINATHSMSMSDLFTGRAQRNIDLLLGAIDDLPDEMCAPMRLCLTAASGQMSNMVFAVTGRGKTTGKTADKIEVGSWVIGYWRPKLHFEINVWSCFERRVTKLVKALAHGDPLAETVVTASLSEFQQGTADIYLRCGDCGSALASIPAETVRLVITDPPHSDRIPYLELSELWNSLIGREADFSREVVVSNAKERGKDANQYNGDMQAVFNEIARVLTRDGHFVLLFNARRDEDWAAIRELAIHNGPLNQLTFLGGFPCVYSTGSVVQDNRTGGLKHDYALVFGKQAHKDHASLIDELSGIPGWTTQVRG